MTGCKHWYEVLCCPFPLNWWKRLWTRRSPPLPSTVALFRSLGALYLLVLLFPTAPSTSASGWEGWSLAVVSTIRAAQAHAGSQHGLSSESSTGGHWKLQLARVRRRRFQGLLYFGEVVGHTGEEPQDSCSSYRQEWNWRAAGCHWMKRMLAAGCSHTGCMKACPGW